MFFIFILLSFLEPFYTCDQGSWERVIYDFLWSWAAITFLKSLSHGIQHEADLDQDVMLLMPNKCSFYKQWFKKKCTLQNITATSIYVYWLWPCHPEFRLRQHVWTLLSQDPCDHQTMSISWHVGFHVTSMSLSRSFYDMITLVFYHLVYNGMEVLLISQPMRIFRSNGYGH